MNALARARSLTQAIYHDPQRWDANLAEAEALLREALRAQPHDPELLTGLGTVLCDLGRYAEAATTLRQALARGSRDRNTCFNLGVALRNGAGRRHAPLYFAKAQALQASPRSWEAYFDPQAQ